jgi:hypothetical protein
MYALQLSKTHARLTSRGFSTPLEPSLSRCAIEAPRSGQSLPAAPIPHSPHWHLLDKGMRQPAHPIIAALHSYPSRLLIPRGRLQVQAQRVPQRELADDHKTQSCLPVPASQSHVSRSYSNRCRLRLPLALPPFCITSCKPRNRAVTQLRTRRVPAAAILFSAPALRRTTSHISGDLVCSRTAFVRCQSIPIPGVGSTCTSKLGTPHSSARCVQTSHCLSLLAQECCVMFPCFATLISAVVRAQTTAACRS